MASFMLYYTVYLRIAHYRPYRDAATRIVQGHQPVLARPCGDRSRVRSPTMSFDTTESEQPMGLDTLLPPAAYLEVARLDDGRYRVQLVKEGAARRTSYAPNGAAVVRQAQHAGNLSVHTTDVELRGLCCHQQVGLLAEPVEEPRDGTLH